MMEVRWSKQAVEESEDTEQSSSQYSILAREAFSSGCHYWEVVVWEKPYWLIGLSYKTEVEAGDADGSVKPFCYIYHGNGKYLLCNGSEETVLSAGKKIHKLGVWVDFQRGSLSFYDGDMLTLLRSFTVQFLGPITLMLNPCIGLDGQNMEPLLLFNLKGQK